ncbi:DUF4956 domain-containing protein [Paenibacillus thermoaerophilus]|uniref:DUF4956 domain-containing protein n=1 Tax=Paenibacillus thermoaerophilus TaxID=1215385 RepID=A0ABW2V7F6_9BACL|nr:DUF4956 domain-containing protein [Paenibacillus thermoaerophilus]TMV11156.1 DUF4956 domain-containing protein [Paenibacillus thermoaerophilus]
MNDVINFQDIIKKSFLHLESFRNVSYIDMILGLTFSFLIGMFIYMLYHRTFRGVVYSYNYNVSFVLMTMITALIIMTISTNIVLSLGMVGALSIVRFRTAVKDPLDIVYMFWSISAGIACGARMYPLAVGGSLAIGIVVYWLSRRKVRGQPYLLIVRHTEEATDQLRAALRQLNGKLKSKTVRKGFTELTIEIVMLDDNTAFMQKISELAGVSDVSLINYTGDYAQ